MPPLRRAPRGPEGSRCGVPAQGVWGGPSPISGPSPSASPVGDGGPLATRPLCEPARRPGWHPRSPHAAGPHVEPSLWGLDFKRDLHLTCAV